MANNILASGVANADHIKKLDQLAADRFAAVPLEVLLIYMIDTCPVEALPILADQFDVLGYKGWRLATSEEDQRDLLKRAIDLHRHKGTIWSIREAVKALGYADIEIIEHAGWTYSGVISYDGSYPYSGSHWAVFRAVLDLGDDKGITAQQSADLVATINEYKNVRSHLLDLSFISSLSDEFFGITDELEVTRVLVLEPDSDTFGDGIYYDGEL